MPYSAGTVFLEVVPSYHNIQRANQRAAQDAGRTFEKEMGASFDKVDQKAAKSAKSSVGHFEKELNAALKRGIADIRLRPEVDGDRAEKQLRKILARMEAFSDLKIGVDVTGEEALAQAKKIEQQLKRIIGDVEVDVDTRSNAAQARKELAQFREAVLENMGLTRREIAERRALLRQQEREEKAAHAEKLRRMREAARVASETENNMAREAAAFRRRQKDERRAELQDVREHNRAVVEDYRRAVEKQKRLLDELKVKATEARERAIRTGSKDDRDEALAALERRLRAENDLEDRRDRLSVVRNLARVSSEKITAEKVESAWRDAYGDIDRAAARSSATRVALARLTGNLERAEARKTERAHRSALRDAWVANIGQAANSFRLFNGALLTAVTLGPVLIPILAGIAGGLGAISVMALGAVAGIGVLVAGFGGIGGALQALSAAEKEQRKPSAAGKSGTTAAELRALRDAQTSLARAREDSGRRIAQAARAQADAEATLTKAVKDARQAQLDLVAARKTASEQLEDMNNRLKSGLLDEQLAAFALQEAGWRLNSVLEDDQASAREKQVAQLEYDRQVQQFKELQTSNKRLADEVADANKKGVEGSDVVVDAKQRVVDANQNVRDSEQAVKDAQADVARARVEEARTIADAEQAVADAMARTKEGAVAAGIEGSAAMSQLEEAMRNLSPAGQEFARFLYSLKPFLDAVRDAAQTGLLPGVQSFITDLLAAFGPDIIQLVGSLAQVMGDLFTAAGKALKAPFWREFFDMVAEYAPVFLGQVGSIIGSLLEAFAGIAIAFAPIAVELGDFLVEAARGFAEWAKSLNESPAFQKFLDYLRTNGEKIAMLLGLLFEAFIKLGIGLAPYADKLLDLLIGFAGWLAEQDPEDLAKMALAVLAFVAAIQALAGALAFLSSLVGLIQGVASILGIGAALGGGGAAAGAGAAAAAGPGGWIVLAVVAVIAALVGLGLALKDAWDKSDEFRERVTYAFSLVQQAIEGVIGVVTGVFNAFLTFLQQFVFPVIWALWSAVIKPAFDLITGIFSVVTQVVSALGSMFYQTFRYIIAPLFGYLYDEVIKPWWQKNVQPILDTVGKFIEDHVAPAWQSDVDAIAAIWNSLRELVAAPIRWVIENVINKGIIGTFNKVADVIPGMTPIKYVTIPDGLAKNGGKTSSSNPKNGPKNGRYASGGILPGYTPGRDVHRFYSPTAGTLDLSGGEGIARPELVAAIGAARWNAANAAARRGDVRTGLRYLGGYADGGILGWLKGATKSVSDTIGGVVGNIRDLLANPGQALRNVVDALIPTSKVGLSGLVRGLPLAIVDGVAGALGKVFSHPGKDTPGGVPGMGYKRMAAIVTAGWPGARISSSYRPGAVTAVGTTSLHGLGRAVDVVPPSMGLFNWIKGGYPNSTELLYSPAGARQLINGRESDTTGITKAMHYNHVHWGMAKGGIVPQIRPNLYDSGGALPPGLSLVLNKTGKPEQVLTDAQFEAIKGNGAGRTENWRIDRMGADPREVALELDRLRRDRYAAQGLTEALGVTE